jgi:hypothetical protein
MPTGASTIWTRQTNTAMPERRRLKELCFGVGRFAGRRRGAGEPEIDLHRHGRNRDDEIRRNAGAFRFDVAYALMRKVPTSAAKNYADSYYGRKTYRSATSRSAFPPTNWTPCRTTCRSWQRFKAATAVPEHHHPVYERKPPESVAARRKSPGHAEKAETVESSCDQHGWPTSGMRSSPYLHASRTGRTRWITARWCCTSRGRRTH